MLERVAHFSIVAKLGQGGMGVVFKAQDTKLRRAVALKLLPPEHVGDAERRARFMREARSAAAVTHPNIATIYEIGEDEAGRVFIAMELVDGQSLRDKLVKEGPLAANDAVAIARQIARGLAKAHDIGLVHRDLKPDNVMLTSEGEAKILDFGLAKAHVEETTTPSMLAEAATGEMEALPVTQAGVILGTPGYMSPEQATGKPVDLRTDLFALGVMLFEMLSGKLPFRGGTIHELLIATVRDEPRRLADYAPNVPPALSALIEQCLAKEPAARPADARALIAALDAAPSVAFAKTEPVAISEPPPPAAQTSDHELADEPSDPALAKTHEAIVSAPPEVITPTPTKPRRWWPALVVIAAGAAVVIAGVVGDRRPVVHASSDASAEGGLAFVELPDPNCNAAAIAEYRAALVENHGRGVGYGHAAFERAIKADPTCAEAELRAAIDTPGTAGAREHYNRAALLRSRLDAGDTRDLALIDVYAPFYKEPPDYRESMNRLWALSKSRPRDADLLVQLGFFLWVRDEDNQLPILAQRAIDIDPGYSTAWLLLGIARMKTGDDVGAQKAFDECSTKISTAVDCVEQGAQHAQWMGLCDEMEASAKLLTSRAPDKKGDTYLLLASALAANGADEKSTSEALSQFAAELEPKEAFRGEIAQARLALAYGEFERARAILDGVEQMLKLSLSRSSHAAVAQLRFDLNLELDRPAEALAIGEDFAARQAVWRGPLDEFYGSGDEGFHLVPRTLALKAVSGKITPARRDKEIHAWVEKNDTVLDARTDWVAEAATLVVTPDDAKRALATLPVPDASGPKIAPLRGYSSAIVGRVLALGGRWAEGIAELQRFTSRCERLDNPIIQTQAYLWLGEALESAKSTKEACAAYAVVTSRWHGASKSAKRAAERQKALGCSP